MQIKALAVTGLRVSEWKTASNLISKVLAAHNASLVVSESFKQCKAVKPLEYQDETFFGTNGRYIILQYPPDSVNEVVDKAVQDAQLVIEELTREQDKRGDLHQPVYLYLQDDDKVVRSKVMEGIVKKGRDKGYFKDYFPSKPDDDASCDAANPRRFVPSKVWKINQHLHDEEPPTHARLLEVANQKQFGVGVLDFPDWGTVAIFDDLVSEDLRSRLLQVVLGPNKDNWDDVANGPDPSRWTRGGVTDYGTGNSNEWGMAGENLVDIMMGNHPAMAEMESLIGQLFVDYRVARMPVLDFMQTPLNINAPTRHNQFGIHYDSNPLFPMTSTPSMWGPLFGLYNNRVHGRPVFVSVLVYLSDEWDEAWGAPTSFRKFTRRPTGFTTKDIQARPGRVVVMHSDVWHKVNPPNDLAGERPRYSMVWRLILYPKSEDQPMRWLDGAAPKEWPEAEEILA